MFGFGILTGLVVLPLVGAAFILALRGDDEATRNNARWAALVTTLITFILSIVAWGRFEIANPAFQLVEQKEWLGSGIIYKLGVDGISMPFVLLTAFLMPFCILASWETINTRVREYMIAFLVLETLMIGVFCALDLVLFYVFFEGGLIPMFLIIGIWGGKRRIYASFKFFLYTLAGSLLMLLAIFAMYGVAGTTDIVTLLKTSFPASMQKWLWLAFFASFAVKMPMWPVHTWLPDAATEARPATAVLLIGVLDKVGTYGMIRFCLQMFPEASKWATPVVIVLAVISVLYGALLAIGQTDIMRLIAYTSVSHFGFIVLGIFAMTSAGTSGSALYMVNHGFTTAALILVAAMLIRRRGSKRIPDYGGWQRVAPVLAGVFLISGLSALALPGLNSFVSEFLVLVGTFQRYRVAAVLATVGIIFAALYVLLMYERMMTGPKPDSAAGTPDLSHREKWVVAPLIAAFLVLGFYPQPVLNVINPAVARTLSYVGVTDPAPTHPGTAEGAVK